MKTLEKTTGKPIKWVCLFASVIKSIFERKSYVTSSIYNKKCIIKHKIGF